MSNQARVRLDVEGGPESARQVRDFAKAFADIGKAATEAQKATGDKFKAIGTYVAGMVAGAVRDFASMSASLARVDPASSANKFRDYRRTLTEFGIASKRSVDDLRASFQTLSDRTVLPQEEVASFSRALAKSTYDTKDSSKAVEALAGFASMTGRSLDEMGGAAETLHNRFGVQFEDMPRILGHVEAAANKLGTAGGPAALMNQLEDLGASVSQLSVKSERDVKDIVGVMGALGKGFRPEQAKQVQQSLTSIFTQGGEQLRVNMGMKYGDFYDEQGNIKLTRDNVARYRQYLTKRAGGEQAARRLMSFHDPHLAAALFRSGFDSDLSAAAGAAPSGGAAESLQALRASEHGVETSAANAREARATQEVGSAVNAAQQATARALPTDPWARVGLEKVSGAAGDLVSNGLKFAGGALGLKALGVLGGGGAAAAGGGGAAAGGGMLAAVGLPALAFLGGGAVGAGMGYGLSKLDDRYDVSGDRARSNLRLAAKSTEIERDKVQRDAVRSAKAVAGFVGGSADVTQLVDALSKLTDRLNRLNPSVRLVDDTSHPNRVVDDNKGQAARQ